MQPGAHVLRQAYCQVQIQNVALQLQIAGHEVVRHPRHAVGTLGFGGHLRAQDRRESFIETPSIELHEAAHAFVELSSAFGEVTHVN